MKMKIIASFLYFFVCIGWAQDHALGLMMGGSNYSGDIGNAMLIRPNKLAFGAIYKWQWTPRISLRASVSMIKIHPSSFNASNFVRQSYGISFEKDIFELASGIDFNLFPYDLTRRNTFQGAPFFILELAAIQYNKAESFAPSSDVATQIKTNEVTSRTLAIPFGVGYKVQLWNRFSLAVEAKIRYVLLDDLDDGSFVHTNIVNSSKRKYKLQFNEPYVGDFYSIVGFTFVYTFGKCNCQ